MRPNWRNGKKSVTQKVEDQLVVKEPIFTAENKLPNPMESTSMLFFDICKEFTLKLKEEFPLELKVEEFRDYFLKSETQKFEVGKQLAKQFSDNFKDDFSFIVDKNVMFFKHPKLMEFDVENKLLNKVDLTNAVWEYLKNLVQYSGMIDMYEKCPEKMLTSISNMAGDLINKMQNGTMELSNLNPLQLGQMLMNDMKSEDLEEFGAAIMESGNMQNMMSLMQSNMASVPGMPDLSSLASMAQMMNPK